MGRIASIVAVVILNGCSAAQMAVGAADLKETAAAVVDTGKFACKSVGEVEVIADAIEDQPGLASVVTGQNASYVQAGCAIIDSIPDAPSNDDLGVPLLSSVPAAQ